MRVSSYHSTGSPSVQCIEVLHTYHSTGSPSVQCIEVLHTYHSTGSPSVQCIEVLHTYHSTGSPSVQGIEVMNSCLGGQEGVWQQLEHMECVSLSASRHQQVTTTATERRGHLDYTSTQKWLYTVEPLYCG